MEISNNINYNHKGFYYEFCSPQNILGLTLMGWLKIRDLHMNILYAIPFKPSSRYSESAAHKTTTYSTTPVGFRKGV